MQAEDSEVLVFPQSVSQSDNVVVAGQENQNGAGVLTGLLQKFALLDLFYSFPEENRYKVEGLQERLTPRA